MATFRRNAVGALSALAAAATFLTAAPASAAPDQAPTAPCYNGIAPFNPYIDNCAIPNRPPRVLGSAPDQTAILNCSIGGRAWRAVCLSQFVNGGPYPGITLGIG
ncbi:MAG: hypothetical protein WCP30_16665 [Mycobacteriaceae bacterium]